MLLLIPSLGSFLQIVADLVGSWFPNAQAPTFSSSHQQIILKFKVLNYHYIAVMFRTQESHLLISAIFYFNNSGSHVRAV